MLHLPTVKDLLREIPAILNAPITLSERHVITHGHPRQHRRNRGDTAHVPGQLFSSDGNLGAGTATHYAIGGEDFVITPETFVLGALEVGASARVKGVVRNGTRYAQSIVVMLRT